MTIPRVSILLPVRNEGKYISKTVNSLLEQDYPDEMFEIVIADGNSNDNTKDELEKLKKQFKLIRVINNPGITMPKGFNLAFSATTSDFILMYGGHSIIPKNYISKSVENIIKYNADCSGGILNTTGEGFWGKIIASTLSSRFGVGNVSFRVQNAKPGYVNSVPYGCYKRTVFEKLGLLDEELARNQDDEFNFRIIQAGMKIWQDSSLVINYYCRSTLRKLFKQYFEYGLYKVRVIQKRNQIISLRHLVPSLFFISLLIPYFSFYSFVAYFYTSLFFSIKIGKFNIIKWFACQISFFVIHFSYGIGFLYGLFRFKSLWSKDE